MNYASLAAAAFGTVAGAVRIELTSSVLETEVLAFERHPNIDKTDFWLSGKKCQLENNLAVTVFSILPIYYIIFFYKNQVNLSLLRCLGIT